MQWVKIMLAEEILPLFFVNIRNNGINRLLFGSAPADVTKGSAVAFKKKESEILNLAQP